MAYNGPHPFPVQSGGTGVALLEQEQPLYWLMAHLLLPASPLCRLAMEEQQPLQLQRMHKLL